MSRVTESVQTYWDARSELFGNYYINPSLFDKVMRKGVYSRILIATATCKAVGKATVLDIGSGPGVNSVSLIKNAGAVHVTGIDFAQQMIDFAGRTAQQEGVADRCSFVLGDALSYDFGQRVFDFSMALGVMDYVADAQALVQRMSRLSTKAFVISWPRNGLRMWLRRRRYTCPLFHYTEEQIRELHRKAGIDTDKLEVVPIRGGWTSIARK